MKRPPRTSFLSAPTLSLPRRPASSFWPSNSRRRAERTPVRQRQVATASSRCRTQAMVGKYMADPGGQVSADSGGRRSAAKR